MNKEFSTGTHGGILSVRHYDFAAQYRDISNRLSKASFENIPALMERITKESGYHSDVRKSIKELWVSCQ